MTTSNERLDRIEEIMLQEAEARQQEAERRRIRDARVDAEFAEIREAIRQLTNNSNKHDVELGQVLPVVTHHDDDIHRHDNLINLLGEIVNNHAEVQLELHLANDRHDKERKQDLEERRQFEAAAAQRHEQLMTRLADILQLLVDRGNNGASAP